MASVDILIPVYNEGEGILKILEALDAEVKTPSRVLICYDEDSDNTLPAIRAFCHSRESGNPAGSPIKDFGDDKDKIVLVKNESRGVHGAIMTGFRKSTAGAVIVFPADDNYNAGILDTLYEKFKQGADIVAPSRFMKGGCMKGCPWLKSLLVRLAAFSLYHVARVPTHDPTNGFRLFSRRVITKIPIESSEGFAFSVELLVKCHRLGWRIEEMPALWFEKPGRRSRFRVFKWLPVYLRWYWYAFQTAFGKKRNVISSRVE